MGLPEREHTVTQAEAGRTVKHLALRVMGLSESMFSSLKFSGGIWVDGHPARANERLETGQTLKCRWEEKGRQCPEAYDLSLSIPYEDDHYLIIDKPAPLPVLSSARQQGPTVENALYGQMGRPENYLFRPVNRLDKGTSGLMTAALDANAQYLLQRQLHSPSFVREYMALCRGALPDREGTIALPIAQRENSVKREIRPDGLKAVTHYRVEAAGERGTLVRLRLETGRTHQIRVHLAALGCPIAGDYLYGTEDAAFPGRFALHSCRVCFLHPFTGEQVEVQSPFPESWKTML